MRLGRSANPALNKNTFANVAVTDSDNVMTLQGAVTKIAILFLILLASSVYTWRMFFQAASAEAGFTAVMPFAIGGAIGGLVLGLITVFAKKAAPILSPFYAIAEGLFLGGISAGIESRYPGIVLQAVALTMGILVLLLLVYKTGIIKVTNKFRLGVVAATGAVFLVYMVSWIMSLLGFQGMGFIHSGGWLGIVISLVIIVIASLNLILDFDFIERGAESGAPKYMEWYAAFGLMVTLVWLYLEILRLLAILAGRD